VGVVYCQECGNPWGVMAVGEVADAALRDAFMEMWTERWQESSDDPRWTPELPDPNLPLPSEVECFWMTEADGAWLCDYIGHEPEVGDLPCWNEYHRGAVPVWWVRRRLRTFTRWDCCNLPNDPADSAGLYEPIPA